MASSSMSSSSSSSSFPVALAVYDLSHGMARSLSAQFLGGPQYAIDIIPHTGIVVYGREYFYGGGIQSEEPVQFRQAVGLQPVQIMSLGHTAVARHEFEQWCYLQQQPGNSSGGGKYHAAAYDLLTRNCNHFSHDAALQGLRLAQGVPDWILSVPQRFLSSPMGQMVRPMLQNMQLTAPVQGAQPVALPTQAPRPPVAAPQAPNPWADTVAATTPCATNDSKRMSDQKKKDEPKANIRTPLLNSYNKPLFSSETKTVPICVQKLLSDSSSLSEPDDRLVLQQVKEQLTPSPSLADAMCDVLWRCFLSKSSSSLSQSSSSSSSITFALMLLRLVWMTVPDPRDNNDDNENNNSARDKCFKWIQDQLVMASQGSSNSSDNDGSGSSSLVLSSPHARSMAWLCAANAIGSRCNDGGGGAAATADTAGLVGVAISNVMLAEEEQQPPQPVSVRQAASAFLYNVALMCSQPQGCGEEEDELPDEQVSMLCSSLEGLVEETDATVQVRRLVVVGRILLHVKQPPNSSSSNNNDIDDQPPQPRVNSLAQSLVQDLGLVETLQQVVETTKKKKNPPGSDATKVAPLALELIELINDG